MFRCIKGIACGGFIAISGLWAIKTYQRESIRSDTLEEVRNILKNKKNKEAPQFSHSPEAIRNRGGIRILSLDGGGTRGVVQLQYLKHLEKETGQPINELFDLIVGTSTGGLIAVALGLENYTVEEVEQLYRVITKPVFGHGIMSTLKNIHSFFNFFSIDEYLLQEIYKILAGNKKMLSYGEERKENFPYVAVVTERDGNHVLLSSWKNDNEAGNDDDWPVWEALRATTAAPIYFSPHSRSNSTYRDGGTVANNPAKLAYEEANKIWKKYDIPIKCLVSIGTGNSIEFSGWKVNDYIKILTNTERVNKDMKNNKDVKSYWRFNPPIPSVDLSTSDSETLERIKNLTYDDMNESEGSFERSLLVRCLKDPKFVFPRNIARYMAYNDDVRLLDVIRKTKDLYMSYWFLGNHLAQDREDWKGFFKNGLNVTFVLPKPDMINDIAGGVHFSDKKRNFRANNLKDDTENKVLRSQAMMIKIFEEAQGESVRDNKLSTFGSLTIYESEHPQHYSLYIFDDEFAFVSLFEDDWGRGEIKSPLCIYDLQEDENAKKAKNFFDKERNSLKKNGKVVYPKQLP